MRFRQGNPGEPLEFKRKRMRNSYGVPMKLACCDCGLVHKMWLDIGRDSVFLTAWRDEKETRAQRAGMKRRRAGVYADMGRTK